MKNGCRIICDTNVLVDYLLPLRPGHSKAVLLFDGCGRCDARMMCVSLSLKDVDYLSKMSLKREIRNEDSAVVWATVAAIVSRFGRNCVETLLGILEVVAVDESVCREALELGPAHNDYEDDLIIAASRQANADMVVTGDKALIRHFPDICVSVEDALMQTVE